MLPRRRNVAGGNVTERSPVLEDDSSNYDKLDKKGNSYLRPSKPIESRRAQTHVTEFAEEDYKFDFLEDFVFDPVMAARDRTNEFITAVRSLQGRTLARPVVRDERKAAVLETYSSFMSMAKVISKNITSTYAKLEKLAIRMY